MATPSGYALVSYELKHAQLSRSAYLTFGIDPSGTDPNSVATQCAVAFAAVGSLFTAIDNEVTLVRTRVQLGTDGGEDIVGVSTQQVACTASIISLPPNCAVLVHKVTARGGRRGRGRMYLPWATTHNTTNQGGALPSTIVTTVQNACNTWLSQLAGGAGPLVLLHRPSEPGVEHPTSPGPPNVVTGLSVDPVVATQRRRLGR